MPPIRRGRLPARARAGRGRPYGRRRRLGLRDANAPRGGDVAIQVTQAVPVPQPHRMFRTSLHPHCHHRFQVGLG